VCVLPQQHRVLLNELLRLGTVGQTSSGAAAAAAALRQSQLTLSRGRTGSAATFLPCSPRAANAATGRIRLFWAPGVARAHVLRVSEPNICAIAVSVVGRAR